LLATSAMDLTNIMQGSRVVVSVAVALAACAACGDNLHSGAEEADADSGVTYYQHLKPIVDARCTGCHNAEGIAPFSLETYEDVLDRSGLVLDAVEAGAMPPWPPNDECNEYRGNRSLSDEHKAVFRAWADGGKHRGDASQPAAPLEVGRRGLSRVDLELSMATAYQPRAAADQHDDYRCFVIPWPELSTTFVTGFDAIPGNPSIVHHVIPYVAQPAEVASYQQLDQAEDGAGYTCFGGPGGPARNWFGVWTPSPDRGGDFPTATGLRVEPGSALILQVHYSMVDPEPRPDRTAVQFKLDATVEKPAVMAPFANPAWVQPGGMPIPAGAPEVAHAFQMDLTAVAGGPFRLHASGVHMHQLGARGRVSIERAGGGSDCLLEIDDYDYHWQGMYELREPVLFNPGDQLRLECHWDNSAENQPLVGGQPRVPRDVSWGQSSDDEMCIGELYVAAP